MGSSRLPGKVLADVAGAPALSRLLTRLRRCRLLDDVVLATSTNPIDDALEGWARASGVAVHRGSEEDVLQRVVEAQHAAGGEIAVEITGDCVLTDPEVVDLGVETFLAHECDVVSNCAHTLTWPMGIYVQVFPVRLLEEVAAKVPDPAVREHVSLYFYEHTERYRLIEILAPPRWRAPGQRLQLDYPEDLALLTAIYRELEPVHGEAFGVEEILALLRRRPDLAALNRHCVERPAR